MQDGQKVIGQVTTAINTELAGLNVIKNMSQADKDELIGGLGTALQTAMPHIVSYNPDQKIDDQIERALGNAGDNPHSMYLATKSKGRMVLTNVVAEFINLAQDFKLERKAWKTQLRL